MRARYPLRAAKLVDSDEDAARTGLPRGQVLTAREVELLESISSDPDYVAVVLYYKRVFDSVIVDVIPPAPDAPVKTPITQIKLFEEGTSA